MAPRSSRMDLILERPDAITNHIIQAIGSSSLQKGQDFIKKFLPGKDPSVYGSYAACYNDPDVDIVYIGTPHAFHKQNCLDAIAAGKHVLCEKAFAITAREAREILDAARVRNMFVMEAMWTRHFPLVKALQRILHEEKLRGDIKRVFCDSGMKMDISSLGQESRLKNPALGAGSLLDVGIYS
ncbi:related to dimeric dihydrodiol dehydrogenase [Cephalotrichum gorgonifer]|uniref:D-xylose 1-dehydrogenase (NADP(+), D-xylono-1,5-lactone-forming) n=1 Tax=Cephalotrichum gorgonifer TaxID=2041049 RepID=A0AAE8T0F9_9PEZI|nr:related to dimeric dihydrodiol dehydrogenase [Cephalotrichum gorgonifer]